LGKKEAAVLLGFGFVFAQSQAALGMLLRSSLAKTPKFLAAEWLHYFLKRSLIFRPLTYNRQGESPTGFTSRLTTAP